jgi:hypothetical protein
MQFHRNHFTCTFVIPIDVSLEQPLAGSGVPFTLENFFVRVVEREGKGQGGLREDFQYYPKSAEI